MNQFEQILVEFKKMTCRKEEVVLHQLMNVPELLCSEKYKPCFSLDGKKDFKLEDLRKTDLLLKTEEIKLEHPVEECACYVYKGAGAPLALEMAHEGNTPVLKLVNAPKSTNPHFDWRTGKLVDFKSMCEKMQDKRFNKDDFMEIKPNTLYVDECREVYFLDALGKQVLNLKTGEGLEQTVARKANPIETELKTLDNQSELMLKAASMKYWSLARVSPPSSFDTIHALWKQAGPNPVLLLERDLYPDALFHFAPILERDLYPDALLYFAPMYEIKEIGGVFVCAVLK